MIRPMYGLVDQSTSRWAGFYPETDYRGIAHKFRPYIDYGIVYFSVGNKYANDIVIWVYIGLFICSDIEEGREVASFD